MEEKIIPYQDKVWLKLEPMKLGGISLEGQNLVSEVGQVVFCLENPFFKKGDRVYFKAWAADHIQADGEDYYVLDLDSKGILGKDVRQLE